MITLLLNLCSTVPSLASNASASEPFLMRTGQTSTTAFAYVSTTADGVDLNFHAKHGVHDFSKMLVTQRA